MSSEMAHARRLREEDVLLDEATWLGANRVRLAFTSGLVLELELPWKIDTVRGMRIVDNGRALGIERGTGIFASYLARMRGRVLRGKRPGPPWPRPTKQSIAASLPPPVRGQHVVLSHAVARALGRSASGVHALDRILKPTRAVDRTRCYDVERVIWLANILERMP